MFKCQVSYYNSLVVFLSYRTIYDSIQCESDPTAEETHEQVLLRLNTELARRKELQARLQAVLQRKRDTEAALSGKLKRFEELKHQLQALLKVILY